MHTQFDSLDHKNQFTFTCPLFNAKSRMGACVELRDRYYKGERPEVRKGCQAAVECGKCPAAKMVTLYCFDKTWQNDHHGSMQPKEGRLHAQVLQKVRAPMMMDKVMDALNVPTAERLLLDTANDRIDAQLKTAPGELKSKAYEPVASSKRRSIPRDSAPAKPKVESSIQKAAATGDLSAAVNA